VKLKNMVEVVHSFNLCLDQQDLKKEKQNKKPSSIVKSSLHPLIRKRKMELKLHIKTLEKC
jgi:hypothetical protein